MRNRSLLIRLVALILGIMLLTLWAANSVLHYSVQKEFTEIAEEVNTERQSQATAHVELARELANSSAPIEEVARSFVVERGETPGFLLLDNGLSPVFTNSPSFDNAQVAFDTEGHLEIAAGDGKPGRRRIELTTNSFQEVRGQSGQLLAYLVALPSTPGDTDGADFATDAWMRIAVWLVLILVIGMTLVAVVLRRAIQPVDRLTKAALALNEGRIPGELASPRIGELEALFAAFNSATATIGRTAELRKQMIADIAHELRTPLTNLRARVEAYDAGLIDDRDALGKTLLGEINLLERLVDDFQQLALSESGQLSISMTPFDLADLASSTVRAVADKSSFAVRDNLSNPIVVSGDPDRMQQVLLNLIENSMRHRRDGLIIRLDPVAAGDHRGLYFSDNGPGIAEGANERIFERFYRGDISRQQDSAGAGLGLTIARSLVNAMDGKITVASIDDEDGTGARFEILLPVAAQ